MRHPNDHDQPVEGGRDVVERALQKQEERERKRQQKSNVDNNSADQPKTQTKPSSR